MTDRAELVKRLRGPHLSPYSSRERIIQGLLELCNEAADALAAEPNAAGQEPCHKQDHAAATGLTPAPAAPTMPIGVRLAKEKLEKGEALWGDVALYEVIQYADDLRAYATQLEQDNKELLRLQRLCICTPK